MRPKHQQRAGNLASWLPEFIGLTCLLFFLATLFRYLTLPELDFSHGLGNQNLNEKQEYTWPQWLGPNRDGVSPESGLLAQWPENGPPEVWSVPLGPGYSSMAIARGRLVTTTYLDGREIVVCLNADTGKDIWRRSYAASYAGHDKRFNQGPRSTPAIDEDRVYTVGAAGAFICWRLHDGEELWRHNLRQEFEVEKDLDFGDCFSPLVVKDLVYVNPGGKKGSLAAFHKITGELVWSVRDDENSYCSPILIHAAGKDQLLIFNAKHLVSVSPVDGKEFWSLPWETNYDLNVTTPLFIENDIFISTGYGTGSARLKVLADDAGNLRVQTVYKSKRLSNHVTNIIFHNGFLYGVDGWQGHLVCLDFANGQEKWKQPRTDKGHMVLADGKLIILFENGKLALVQPNPEKYQEISSFQFFTKDKCWAAPALANKRLFVRDGEKLVCFDLRSP